MKMPANLRSLIGKLNDTARKAMEGAAGLCLARTHYDIEVEHFLLKALDAADGDLSLILRYFEIDKSRLTGELTRGLDKLKIGQCQNTRPQPVADEDADGSLDGRLAGLRRRADPHRVHRSGAGNQRRAGSADAGGQQGIPEGARRRAAQGFC